jgi:hypothetical protein
MKPKWNATWIYYLLVSVGFVLLILYCLFTWRAAPWLGEDSLSIPESLIVSSLLIGVFLTVLAFSDLISRSEAASEVHLGVALALGLILALASWGMPGFLETPIRANITKCRGLMREMTRKIEKIVGQTGEIPRSIDSLFTEQEMLDLFSPDCGKLLWQKTGVKTGVIISVGPNQENDWEPNGDFISYSVTNGSFSKGDIIQKAGEQEAPH